ncbi:MAG: alginate lyase family protein, partial [Alphaproteobacteria bacterium]
MKAAQIIWYARRARTMERGELGSRVARALQGATDYLHCRLRGRSAFQRHLGAGPFRFCHHPDPMLPPLQWEFEPTEAQIDDLLSGVHHALGFPWAWRPDPDAWHRAPDTGHAWPAKFAGLIDHRPGNPVGDVRVTWEPNRLQQLIALALLTKSSPDRCFDAAALLKRQLFCWVDANPMRTGVNYTSAMECALRILSVSFASDLARPLLLRDRAYWAAVTKLILEHAAFVNAHLSLFSSMGNHTVAECAGLFVAALIFPEFPAAAGWEACAREVLERAARREVLADGGAAEQALRYHAQVVDYLEIAVRVGEHFGRDMSTLAALHRSGAAFLARFHVERHDLPCTGDDDEGQALSRHFVSSWADDARRAAKTGSNASVSLWSGGGYSIIRSANDDSELIIDHGPLGLPPNFGHGHADALAVQLRIGGEPVLIDPGTFSYGGDARWRNYFRGTAAHNTVTVDGRSQAKPAGPFLWSTSYACRLIHADSKNDRSAVVVARHDGYESIGVVHT